jgi:hypothetical protein
MILTMEILSQQFWLSEWTADIAILHTFGFCGQEGYGNLDARRALYREVETNLAR